LFGTFDGDTTVIEKATGPRRTDRRSRRSYRLDPDAEQREICEMHACGLHYVGDRHTHPQRVPEPSDLDTGSMTECFLKSEHQLNGFVLVVAGTADFPDGLQVCLVSGRGDPIELLMSMEPSETSCLPAALPSRNDCRARNWREIVPTRTYPVARIP